MNFEAKMGTIVTISGESIRKKNEKKEKARLVELKSKLVGFIENLPIHFEPYAQNQAILALFLIEGLSVKTMMRLAMDDLEISESGLMIRICSEYRFLTLQVVTVEYLKSHLSDRANARPNHPFLFVSGSKTSALTPAIAYRQLRQMGAYRFLRKLPTTPRLRRTSRAKSEAVAL